MEKINDWQECYKDAIKEAVEYLHKIITTANTCYYEGDGTALLNDAEYDEFCKQYVELSKILDKEVELRACSFFRVENVITINLPHTTDMVESTYTGDLANTM